MGLFDFLTSAGASENYQRHYDEHEVKPPFGNRLVICSAFGCRVQQRYMVTPADEQTLAHMFDGIQHSAAERQIIIDAIAYLTRVTTNTVATDRDLAGVQLFGTLQTDDQLDRATNTTTFLLYLANSGFLKHHAVCEPASHWSITNLTRYTAVILDIRGNWKYAVSDRITFLQSWYKGY
jgi:hypothetical protein